MKKILTIIVAMGAMVAYGQTDNSATVSQTDGNKATIVQKGGATINATQLSTGGNGHVNTIVAKQIGVNTATVNQEGKTQMIDLLQKGDGNNIMSLNQINGHSKIININQVGNNNTILPFEQKGKESKATITQDGNRNIIGKIADDASGHKQESDSGTDHGNSNGNSHGDGLSVHQSGESNTSVITQRGDDNALKNFHQSGKFNTATITQKGDENTIKKVHQSSESNATEITQKGNKNTVEKFHQSGQSNTAAITQKGDANTVETFRQSGQSNTATITQKGESDNLVKEFTQKGNSNDVTVSQDGYMNRIDKISVEGHGNKMDVNQKGNNNYFGDQYGRVIGSKNIITVDQKGSYNNAARIDINGSDRNTVTVIQKGVNNDASTGNSSSVIDIRGVENNLLIEQIGASNRIGQVWLTGNNNDVRFKQKGESNNIEGVTEVDYSSNINGDGNVVFAEQIGDGNTVVNGVDVLGNDNTVGLKQIGDNNEYQLTGSPFEGNIVLVDQVGDRNTMETFVKGASNVLKLKVKSSDSETTVTQNGDENKVYAFDGINKAVFEGQELFIDQQGNSNEIKMNTKRSKVTILQNGNDQAEVDNSGTANIHINQLADYNYVKLRGTGNGNVTFVQKNGSYNNINLTFNCDVATDNVDITQDGSHNMVKGLGSNEFGMFCGSNLMITQSGNDNEAMIRSNNGSISLNQIGNSNVASITQSAN